jgi:hypothetical protein
MNHVLIFLAVSNIFLLFASIKITVVTFFAACLLATQTIAVVLVINNRWIGVAPRVLEPTDFMVGLCLGLCIGGVILAFFVSITFRRAFAFCEYAEKNYAEEDHQHACGNLTHRLWSIWWWSTLVFWLDLFTAFLIAVGRSELSSNEQNQYQSIGAQPPEQYGSAQSFQQQQQPTFQQAPQMQQPHQTSGPMIMPV